MQSETIIIALSSLFQFKQSLRSSIAILAAKWSKNLLIEAWLDQSSARSTFGESILHQTQNNLGRTYDY